MDSARSLRNGFTADDCTASDGCVEQLQWIPQALAETPSNWPMCADFLEEYGGRVDAETLRLAGSLALPMVWCPPGSFDIHLGRRKLSPTQARVRLTQSFWVGKYTITQLDWLSINGSYSSATARSKRKRLPADDAYHAKLPMVDISWSAADVFTKRLTRQEQKAGRLPRGWRYALPTEAQWEYACRANTSTKFHFGNRTRRLDKYGWYRPNSAGQYHRVGEKKPNAWGVHDMYGNVWEWCADVWCDRPVSGVDPEFQLDAHAVEVRTTPRVLRGGGWSSPARVFTAGARSRASQAIHTPGIGFRVVLVREQTQRG